MISLVTNFYFSTNMKKLTFHDIKDLIYTKIIYN